MVKNIKNKYFSAIVMLIPIILIIWGVFVMPVFAVTVPHYLGFEGRLTNSSGTALTGTYDITFRIYEALTGGSVIWTEIQSSVSVSSGYFSVNLGDTTALDLDFDRQYWISVEVESDGEMTPRTPINSTGYSFVSEVTFGAYTTSTPPTATAGSMYYNTLDNSLYIYNGSSWEELTPTSTASASSTQSTISDYLWIGDDDTDNLDIRAGVWDLTSTVTTTVAMTNGINFNSGLLVIDPNANTFGIGTTTPAYKLSVYSGNATDNLFQIATTTNQNILLVDSAGNLSLNSTATSTFNKGIQALALNVTSGSVTSTFANGIDLADGCFAVDGVCLAVGANTALSNLASVAINTSLISDANNTDDLGAYGLAWKNLFVSSTAYFGGAPAVDQLVVGSSTPYLIVDASGKVGVGTSTPAYKLDVYGNFYSQGDVASNGYLKFADGYTAGVNQLLVNNTGGYPQVVVESGTRAFDFLAGSNNANLDFSNEGSFNIGSKTYANRGTVTSRTNVLTIVGSTSNVGIGDTTPIALLTVGDTDRFTVDSSGNVSSSGTLKIAGNFTPFSNNAYSIGAYGSAWKNIFASSTAYLNYVSSTQSEAGNFVATNASATSTFAGGIAVETSGLVYDYSTGNVGIGTASPAVKFDLLNTGSGAFAWLGGLSNGRTLKLGVDTNGYVQIQGVARTDGSTRDITLQTDGGNVGIGDTTPIALLTVGDTDRFTVDSSGNVSSSGTLKIAGNFTPFSNNAYSIGAYGSAWKNIFASSTAYLNYVSSTQSEAGNFVATNASATSTFAGGIAVETSGLVYDYSTGRVGIGTASPASILHLNGGVGAPTTGLLFGDGDTGIYETVDDTLSFIAASTRWDLTASAFSAQGSLGASIIWGSGSATAPIFRFSTDSNTGLGGAGSDTLSLITGGASRVYIDSSGFVGIATTTAAYKLVVNSSNATDNLFQISTTTRQNILLVDSAGNLSLNSTATSTFNKGIQALALNVTSGSVTSTFANGIDLADGCFAVDGVCLSTGGSGASTALDNLASVAINTSLISDVNNTDDLGSFGLAWKNLFVSSTAYFGGAPAVNQLVVGSSTPYLIVDASGKVGVGTASPTTQLTVSSTATPLTLVRSTRGQVLDVQDGTDSVGIFTSDGTPESSITADRGSIAVDTTNGALYVKTTDGANTGWNLLDTTTANPDQLAILVDQKAVNTAGGSSVAGEQTRVLNTELYDPSGIVSLSSNQFTLQAGTYNIFASAPALDVDRHQVYLYNVTDSSYDIIGSNAFTGVASHTTESTINGVITIASAKVFEIVHYTQTAISTFGLGGVVNNGQNTIFTQVTIRKMQNSGTATSSSRIQDADNDTYIELETSTDDDTLRFWSGGTQIFFATSTGLLAASNNSLDLGSYGFAWNNIFASSTAYLDFVSSTMLTVSGSTTSTFNAGVSASALNITSASVTSTFANGIDLADGCFAVDGVCLSTGGSGASTALDNLASVAINTSLISDANNTDNLGAFGLAWKNIYASSTAFLSFVSSTNADVSNYLNVTGKIGVATTTPNYKLVINSTNATDKLFQISTSTNQNVMTVDENGVLGVSGVLQLNSSRRISPTGGSGFGSGVVIQPYDTNTNGLLVVAPTGSNTQSSIMLQSNPAVDTTGSQYLAFGGGFSGAPADAWSFGSLVYGQTTGASRPITFVVSNATAGRVEAMRITNTSNIGIATSTPAYKLVVNSTTTAEKLFQISTTTNQNIMTVDENGNVVFGGRTINPSANKNTSLGVFGSAWKNIFASSTSHLDFVSSTNADISNYLNVTGKIGIATTTPNYKLVINSTNSTDNLLQISTSTRQNILIVDSNGNVGISTTTPTTKLEINGNLALSGQTSFISLEDQGGGQAAKGRFKHIAAATHLTSNCNPNISFECTLDDTALPGLDFIPRPGTGNFEFWYTAAGSNPRTLTQIAQISSDGGLSLGSGFASTEAPTGGAIIEGDVGIGINAPTVELEVNKSNTGATAIRVENPTAGAGNYGQVEIDSDTSGGRLALSALSSTFTPSGAHVAAGGSVLATGSGGMSIGTSNAAGIIRFYTGSAVEQMRIDVNGKVGIATTTQNYKLTINSTNGTDKLFQISSTTNQNILIVNENGNVGLGTASPVQELAISKSKAGGNVSIAILNTNNTNTASHASYTVSTGGSASGDPKAVFDISGITDWILGVDNSDSDKFKIANNTTGALETNTRLTINASGNVGIGTDTPIPKFEVAGTASSSLFSSGIAWFGGTNTTTIGVDGSLTINASAVLTVPYSTNPTISAVGQFAIETTSSSIRFHDGTAERALYTVVYRTFTIVSSTLDAYEGKTASSTIPLGVASPEGETWVEISCYTDAGTAEVEFGDGTNWMDYQKLTTTLTTDSSLTNNTFTMREKRYVRVGQLVTADTLTCSVGIRPNAS